MTQMGCNGRNYLQNLEYIQENTGGISSGLNLNLQAHDQDSFFPTFHLKGKALHRKAAKLFTLLRETVAQTELEDTSASKKCWLNILILLKIRLNQNALKYAIISPQAD